VIGGERDAPVLVTGALFPYALALIRAFGEGGAA
jgi:hypothetical protein